MNSYTNIAKSRSTFLYYLSRFARLYLVHMRPYLLFISGVAGAAGMVLQDVAYSMPELILAFLPLFLGYGFGQALTDCFQTDTDAISAPYRPLSQGIVSKKSVFWVSLAGLSVSALIYLGYNPFSFWICALIIFGLATYSYVKKHLTLLAPFYNAAVVGLLPILAYCITSGNSHTEIPLTTLKIAALTFFAYSNFVLIGYLKDIEADRSTGYKTFPVEFGWDITIRLGWVIAFCTIGAFISISPANPVSWPIGLLACIILFYGLLHAKLVEEKNEKTALVSIVSTVRSLILFLLAILIDHKPDLLAVAVIYYLAFELVLRKRPSKYQV
ncbi:MAG TPA: UbiA family prenyltransferase [Chitinophagaceae bacterium]|nr:UbiA family prenyltransferase [Chitinophagaceae bacterium]